MVFIIAPEAMRKPILQTERLDLVELEWNDLGFLVEMLGDPEVMRFWPRPYHAEECEQWIERHRARYRDHSYGYWLALDRALGQPIGQIGLLHQEVGETTELGLGWIVHRPFWRLGYAFEGALGCLNYARDVVGAQRTIALIRPENEPSMALARKLGMSFERVVPYFDFAHAVMAIKL